MNEDEGRFQPDILKREIFDAVDRCVEKYKITYAEAIGVLESCKLALWYENAIEGKD
jgi:hypothetical protein